MWQSTPVLPVQHPATAKSYEPDNEKYFDKQQRMTRCFIVPFLNQLHPLCAQVVPIDHPIRTSYTLFNISTELVCLLILREKQVVNDARTEQVLT